MTGEADGGLGGQIRAGLSGRARDPGAYGDSGSRGRSPSHYNALVSQFDFSFLGVFVFAIEDGDVAEDAGDVALGGLGELGGEVFFLVFEFDEADFDEFVVVERAVGFFDDGGGEALFADVDYGLEVMGEGAELFSLCAGHDDPGEVETGDPTGIWGLASSAGLRVEVRTYF